MRKVSFSLIALILSTSVSFAQYANPGYGDVTKTTEYKITNTAYYGGLVVAGVGTAAWLVGNVICTIELNKYTNSHTTSGTVEEIYSLNQEAKQQPEYKKKVKPLKLVAMSACLQEPVLPCSGVTKSRN